MPFYPSDVLVLCALGFVLLMALLVLCLVTAHIYAFRLPAGVSYRHTRQCSLQRTFFTLLGAWCLISAGMFVLGYMCAGNGVL